MDDQGADGRHNEGPLLAGELEDETEMQEAGGDDGEVENGNAETEEEDTADRQDANGRDVELEDAQEEVPEEEEQEDEEDEDRQLVRAAMQKVGVSAAQLSKRISHGRKPIPPSYVTMWLRRSVGEKCSYTQPAVQDAGKKMVQWAKSNGRHREARGDRNSAPPNTWGEGHISARYGPGNERQAPEGSYPGRLALRG